MARLYAKFDDKNDPRSGEGAFEVTFERAKVLNKEGYGIFFTPNEFNGRRKKVNLSKINYYIVDIDEGGKEKIWSDIEKLVLKPSVIVESKRGYHLYWRVSDGSTIETYEKIEKCIIQKLNGDKGAKDVSRLLRYPNFYHMKDPKNPFLIKLIEKNDNVYKENELYLYFKGREKKYRPISLQNIKFKKLDDFESNEQMLKFFGFKSNTNERHNELLRKIGMMKILQYSQTDRERIIWYMNTQFYKPLPNSEVEMILKTTVNERR